MKTEKLVSMANQMADFFRSYPEAEAEAGIRQHIQAFWTPKMRAAIRADLGNPAMDVLVAGALRGWGDAESPVPDAVRNPAQGGLAATDAG